MNGDDLKKLRIETKLTQRELADRMGLSVRALQDLENGGELRDIHRLALVGLGLTPSDNEDEMLAAIAARRVLAYDRRIELAEQSLQQIADGMTFHEATGSDSVMRDVTERRRAEIVENLEAYRDARRLWLAQGAGRFD